MSFCCCCEGYTVERGVEREGERESRRADESCQPGRLLGDWGGVLVKLLVR